MRRGILSLHFSSPHLHWWVGTFTRARAFGDSCNAVTYCIDTCQWCLVFRNVPQPPSSLRAAFKVGWSSENSSQSWPITFYHLIVESWMYHEGFWLMDGLDSSLHSQSSLLPVYSSSERGTQPPVYSVSRQKIINSISVKSFIKEKCQTCPTRCTFSWRVIPALYHRHMPKKLLYVIIQWFIFFNLTLTIFYNNVMKYTTVTPSIIYYRLSALLSCRMLQLIPGDIGRTGFTLNRSSVHQREANNRSCSHSQTTGNLEPLINRTCVSLDVGRNSTHTLPDLCWLNQ